MYYQEKIINGILHCRHTPNGEWVELTKEAMTEKIIKLREKLESYQS